MEHQMLKKNNMNNKNLSLNVYLPFFNPPHFTIVPKTLPYECYDQTRYPLNFFQKPFRTDDYLLNHPFTSDYYLVKDWDYYYNDGILTYIFLYPPKGRDMLYEPLYVSSLKIFKGKRVKTNFVRRRFFYYFGRLRVKHFALRKRRRRMSKLEIEMTWTMDELMNGKLFRKRGLKPKPKIDLFSNKYVKLKKSKRRKGRWKLPRRSVHDLTVFTSDDERETEPWYFSNFGYYTAKRRLKLLRLESDWMVKKQIEFSLTPVNLLYLGLKFFSTASRICNPKLFFNFLVAFYTKISDFIKNLYLETKRTVKFVKLYSYLFNWFDVFFNNLAAIGLNIRFRNTRIQTYKQKYKLTLMWLNFWIFKGGPSWHPHFSRTDENRPLGLRALNWLNLVDDLIAPVEDNSTLEDQRLYSKKGIVLLDAQASLLRRLNRWKIKDTFSFRKNINEFLAIVLYKRIFLPSKKKSFFYWDAELFFSNFISSHLWFHSLLLPDNEDNVLAAFGLKKYKHLLKYTQKKLTQVVYYNTIGGLAFKTGSAKTKVLSYVSGFRWRNWLRFKFEIKKMATKKLPKSDNYAAYLANLGNELLNLNTHIGEFDATLKINLPNDNFGSFITIPDAIVKNYSLLDFFLDKERKFFRFFDREDTMSRDDCVDWYTDVLGPDETEEDWQLKLDTFLGKIAIKEDRLTEYLRDWLEKKIAISDEEAVIFSQKILRSERYGYLKAAEPLFKFLWRTAWKSMYRPHYLFLDKTRLFQDEYFTHQDGTVTERDLMYGPHERVLTPLEKLNIEEHHTLKGISDALIDFEKQKIIDKNPDLDMRSIDSDKIISKIFKDVSKRKNKIIISKKKLSDLKAERIATDHPLKDENLEWKPRRPRKNRRDYLEYY